jgi:hypothetical protein
VILRCGNIVRFEMRALACAFAALSFAAVLTGPAAAQSYGPSGDSYQSGPPPYYSDRPQSRPPDQGFDRPPPPRGNQNAPWPPAGQNMEPPRQSLGGRAVESRPRPPAPPPVERRAIETQSPPPPARVVGRGPGGASRVMIGPNEIVISIAEYEDLKNQANELQRLRGSFRSDDRDYRSGSGPTYR